MEHEPLIEEEELIRLIRQHYGFEVVGLSFLQRGWGGDCYRLQTAAGEPYFLKINDAVASNETAASSRLFYLPLMHQLHARAILPHIPRPVSTLGGAFSLKVDPRELVLTSWIEGELLGFGELPEPILARLAGLVGVLHRSLPLLEFEYPFIEQFDFPFAADLVASRAALESVSARDSHGKQLLREMLLPRWGELLGHLARLNQLQEQASLIDKPMVICHTDLHGSNLMTDEHGALCLIDWETAVIAPPEHDLIFFAGEANFWDVFWPNYARQFPEASLDCDVLAFYFYRRGLEDVVGFILRILQGEGGEAQDVEDLGWLRECLDGLGQIEATISGLRERCGSF